MKLLRTAIYARHSTDKQNPLSSDDQAAACADVVARHGGVVVGTYADPEVSGYRRDRPGLMRLLEDVRDGAIDMIVCEALDRLARDGEDIAWVGKKLRFDHVRLVTSTEGEIDEVKLAVAGMLGSMFLANLQRKTLRGLKAAVLSGRFAGGRAYGYRRINAVDARGEVVRGVMEIVPAEAEIVRRIHAEFAAGRSSIGIATALNKEGVPGPRGGQWNASTIRGDPSKLVGILSNPLYRGVLVWNRREWRKDPDSGARERRYRLREEEHWVRVAVPDLRIVDDGLASRVDAEFASRRRPADAVPAHRMRRSRHLLSGLIVCGVCGSNYTIAGKDYYRCAGHKERGTCGNAVSVRVEPLERAVLSALQGEMLTPDLVKIFVTEFKREVKRLAKERHVVDELAEARLKAVDREIANISANIVAGVVGPTVGRLLAEREAERIGILEGMGRVGPVRAPTLPADDAILRSFEEKVGRLRETLSQPDIRTEAASVLRQLLVGVTIVPDGRDGPEAEMAASAARMIAYAANENGPRHRGTEGEKCSVMVVAGTGFEPVTFRL